MICRQKTRASSIHRVEDAQRMQRKCLYCFGMLLHRSFVASDRYNTPPRVCGDYHFLPNVHAPDLDTTPRMRGLRTGLYRKPRISRYNPAYAGTTAARRLPAITLPIQPRVCGDYSWRAVSVRSCTDTTPRMRGLLTSSCVKPSPPRYNPAYAGTTVEDI